MDTIEERLPLLQVMPAAAQEDGRTALSELLRDPHGWPDDLNNTSMRSGSAQHSAAGSKRGFLLVLCTALGVFALASTFGRMSASAPGENKIVFRDSGTSPTDQEGGGVSDVMAWQRRQDFDLVSPTNKRELPTKTCTEDCTGDKTRPVLAGADVVAYWELEEGSKPVIGIGAVNATHNGYIFFFSSVENRKAFQNTFGRYYGHERFLEPLTSHVLTMRVLWAKNMKNGARGDVLGVRVECCKRENPEAFLPAWGGFCSYGIAAETVWTAANLGPFGDPSKWKIMPDGRLHVFRSNAPMSKFMLHVDEYIESGNANWNCWFNGRSSPLNTGCFCASTFCTDQ